MPSRPGYEYLSAYILGKVIQDLTVEFCNRYISFKSRTNDQMVQAARSNCQNVAEGFSNPSLKGYIKLAGIAYGSNEELTKDYQDYLRQHSLPIWDKNNTKIREFREFRAFWIDSTTLNTPSLPNSPLESANMLLTFCNMEGFLLKKLVASLLEKHEKEGGLTEELYRKRVEYRKTH
jgi:four helix bundle suffix protein